MFQESKVWQSFKRAIAPWIWLHNTFIRNQGSKTCLVNFCPECGGELEFDPVSKNFICKSCGLFAPREKIDELRDKAENKFVDEKRRSHDAYLEWWQTSKKDKQKAMR